MYATERNSGYEGTPYTQLSTKLGEMQLSGEIGAGWTVYPDCSTPQYAIFVNEHTKEAFIAARGSSSLYADWIANDLFGFIGLFGRRGIRTLEGTAVVARSLQSQKFLVMGTGHSLGGSVMRCVGAALSIPVITFDAPFLQHDIHFNADMRADNSGNVLNVVMSGDIVSLIKSPELGLDSYLQSCMTLMNGSSMGPVDAHSMQNMINALKDFDPATTCLELKKPKRVGGDLFTSFYETEVDVYDAQGNKSTEIIKSIQMSIHREAAVTAAKHTVFAATVNELMSARGFDLDRFMDAAVRQGGINALMTFQTSVVSEQLIRLTGNDVMGRHLTGATIRVVNSLLLSDTKGLKKVCNQFIHFCTFQSNYCIELLNTAL